MNDVSPGWNSCCQGVPVHMMAIDEWERIAKVEEGRVPFLVMM